MRLAVLLGRKGEKLTIIASGHPNVVSAKRKELILSGSEDFEEMRYTESFEKTDRLKKPVAVKRKKAAKKTAAENTE